MEDKFDYFDIESVLMPTCFNDSAFEFVEPINTRDEDYLDYENLYGMPS